VLIAISVCAMGRAMAEASENNSFASNARHCLPRGVNPMPAQLPRSSGAARRGQQEPQVSLYAPIVTRTSRGSRLSNEAIPHPRRAPPGAVLSDITNTGRESALGKPAGMAKVALATAAAPCSFVKPSTQAGSGQGNVSGCASPTSSTRASDMEVDVGSLPGGSDPQGVTEYASDIFRTLGKEECKAVPRPNYMDFQSDINARMRAILVDWLIEVHLKYDLRRDTLFLAVSIVDRFLDKQPVPRKKLQLCGITCLLIAAKFEEIFPPEIRDLVYMTDKSCSKEEILEMEVAILTALQFNLCVPTVAHFSEQYQRANECTEQHRHLVQYLLELTLLDLKMVQYAPSHLAAAAIYLSNKLLRMPDAWPPAMVQQTQLTEMAIKACAREMCHLLEGVDKHQRQSQQAVRLKFSGAKYGRVAKHIECMQC